MLYRGLYNMDTWAMVSQWYHNILVATKLLMRSHRLCIQYAFIYLSHFRAQLLGACSWFERQRPFA